MPPLSNYDQERDAGPSAEPGLQCRLVQKHETDAALRLLLAGPDGRSTDDQVMGFVSISTQRGLDLNTMWVAVQDGRLLWVLLPVISPGRTMLLLSPPHLSKSSSTAPVGSLVERVCEVHRGHGVDLAQMLLDPAEAPLRQFYTEHGFLELAELLYLQRSVRRVGSLPPLAPELKTVNYSPATHALFAQTVARSYDDSLDCPALNGLRNMEDVLAGHKASGEFDPSLWFLLTENDVPRGVLLLSRTTQGNALELVYLGLTREGRGRGFGGILMNLALLSVVRENRSELTLAVDSRNEPALKLYHRHGLRRVGSRAAMIRDLRMTRT